MIKKKRRIIENFKAFRIVIYITIFVLLSRIPIEKIESKSICIIYNIFGIKCFGCGITRAYANILRFNIKRAIEYNNLILIIFPISIFIIINEIYSFIKGKSSVIDKLLYIIYDKSKH